MRTSYKKHRPFDFKLIDHVEPNTLLYKRQTGLSNYDVMKAKTEIWTKIAEIMNSDVDFCVMRWNNLFYQFRKESRRTGGSTWPYFERLQFLLDATLRPKAKSSLQTEAEAQQIQTTDIDNSKESFVEQDAWQSYNDCVVMHVGGMEQNTENSIIIEEIIEPNDHIIQEEIIYEDDGLEEEQVESLGLESVSSNNVEAQMVQMLATTNNNYFKMERLLDQLQGNQKALAERRIMAFALKCQLRTLVNEPIDDLVI